MLNPKLTNKENKLKSYLKGIKYKAAEALTGDLLHQFYCNLVVYELLN